LHGLLTAKRIDPDSSTGADSTGTIPKSEAVTRLVHYPWRLALPAKYQNGHLPVPETGRAAPGIGSFLLNDSLLPMEIPGPTIREGGGQTRCRIAGKDILYDQNGVFQFQREDIGSFPRRLHFALTDAFIHMANLLYEKHRAKFGTFADMRLADACSDFVHYLAQERDFASESLVVEIARACLGVVEGIVSAPRLSLFRRHDDVALDRLQELDEYSLKSLAHRPGRTIAGKAGTKQRLTGVVRVETPNTYENQVLMDFIRRSDRAALQYVREMCGRCPHGDKCRTHDPSAEAHRCPSERVRMVADYHRKCLAWQRSDNMSGVTRLAQPASRANYVLQQNPRYVVVWRYYPRLLRQEDIEEDVWRWERRTWADYLRLVMMVVWDRHLKAGSLVELSRRPLMLRTTNNRGAWLCSDPFEEALVFPSVSSAGVQTVYFLNMGETVELTGIDDLRNLNFDFCWVILRSKDDLRLIPFWAICGSPQWRDSEVDGPMAEEVDHLLSWANMRLSVGRKKCKCTGGVVAIPSEKNSVVASGAAKVWRCVPFAPDFTFAANEVKEALR
jgi:hypothetical protein